jgi:pyridoxal 5'-phosphate synthase pdxT subunit
MTGWLTEAGNMDILLKNTVIGVLALQGAFREHIKAIKKCGVKAVEIKFPKQLDSVDGLIIPGGESTTIYKLIEKYDFTAALKKFYMQKKPIFGTCAGLILLAKEVTGNCFGLGFIDIKVDRNAYGRQVDSFEQPVELMLGPEEENNFIFKSGAGPAGLSEKFNAVFIRAPKIEKKGEEVLVLSSFDSVPVFARQGDVLVCSFHPELTDDLRIHQYFIDMVIKSKNMIKLSSSSQEVNI